ncbi:MAG: guanylate kinase [Coriobacteriales bacterium]|jgi:guanylate kinase|nr:guanylate kinase [Coriobacteriales bacterium]
MVTTGKLFVVSGPSGAGKGTLLARVLSAADNFALTVSATTRKPRKGEKDGVQYYFLSEEKFDELIRDDRLLEWASVHGAYYGTLKSEVKRHLAAGLNVVLEIDLQGARQIRAKMPEAVLIFIMPPSIEVLRSRLEKRGTESSEQITRRLETARLEIQSADEFDTVIVNDDLAVALAQLLQFVHSMHDTVTG